MPTCTFFGHRDCPEEIQPLLKKALLCLIEEWGMDTFYVGHQGKFDYFVYQALQEMKKMYPHICFQVALSNLPQGKRTDSYFSFSDAVLPEGIEGIPPGYRINFRNKWMLKRAQFVMGFVQHSWGGAARYLEQAKRQGKHVINLAQAGNKEFPALHFPRNMI